MTIGEWICVARARLEPQTGSARLEAQLLAAHALGVARTSVLAHPEEAFPELAGESLLQRREAGEPLAYILGRREFFGREFVVRRGVLVPRQETETLVEVALGLDLPPTARVLDIGVGSGCVAMTLALERPAWSVAGSDVSAVALEIARENAGRLGARVDLREGDLLAPFAGERFDLVVSNPPYIDRSEALPREVGEWEPPEALFARENGLEFYRRLAAEGPEVLVPGGWMAVEVGWTQAGVVSEIFRSAGLREVRAVRDLSGIERVVVGRGGG